MRRWVRWLMWAFVSAASVVFLGGIGALGTSGGLNAAGATPRQRLVGSAIAGLGIGIPVALATMLWPQHRRALLGAALVVAVACAGAVWLYSG